MADAGELLLANLTTTHQLLTHTREVAASTTVRNVLTHTTGATTVATTVVQPADPLPAI